MMNGKLKTLAEELEKRGLSKYATSVQEVKKRLAGGAKHSGLEQFIKTYYGIEGDIPENATKWFDTVYALMEDIGLVALSDKPAALLTEGNVKYLSQDQKALFKMLLDIAMQKGYVIIRSPSLVSTHQNFIIGIKENVENIRSQFERVLSEKGGNPDFEYHRTLGENLGYSQEDIDEFLSGKR